MFALIDLGSNSFHLLIGKISDGQIFIIKRCSEKVLLGEQLSQTGLLSNAAITRGLSCLKRFAKLINEYQPLYLRCVATNALRQATDAKRFIKSARKYNIEIEVISGKLEANLIYQGVTGAIQNVEENQQFLVFDVGGGSTEFAIGRNTQAKKVKSLQIGCVSWRDLYFQNNRIKTRDFEKAVIDAKKVFAPIKHEFHRDNNCRVLASSGTAKMLCSISRKQGFSDGQLDRKTLELLAKKCQEFNCVSELNFDGLKAHRRELLLPGLAIFLGIFSELNINKLIYSRTALREGMLAVMLEKPTLSTQSDPRIV